MGETIERPAASAGRDRFPGVLAVVILAAALVVGAPGAARGQQAVVAPCQGQVLRGVLPTWARAGFSERRPRLPHVLSERGQLTAILWADPLLAPAPQTHNNKILWVSRIATVPGSPLRISAQRMSGSTPMGSAVSREVAGGPGPSIIDLPAPGCWRLTLRWSGHVDAVYLVYRVRR